MTTSPIEAATGTAEIHADPGASRPLRIAYLVSQYPAVSHTFILREVFALRERGLLIEVASINAPPPSDKMTRAEQDEAARTFYVKPAGATGLAKALPWMLFHHPVGLIRGMTAAFSLGRFDPARLLLCLFYFAEAIILAHWLRRRSYSHLHVHFATQAATVAMIMARIAPITMSMTVHGPDEFYDVPGQFLPQKVECSRFIVCISFFSQSQLMRLTRGEDRHKFDIARLGVDPSHFAPRPARASPAAFQILCVGRLVPAKGQRILVEAVAQLLNGGRCLELHFVGDGPDRVSLENLVRELQLSDRIFFEGSVNQDRIRIFYEAADIFAIASFAEGIPVVLMEAMSMEIPCIATCINGIPELIRDGVEGLLVPPSDSVAMAAAIARLMDDVRLRESFGQAGRQRILQMYNLGKSADDLASLFRRQLGSNA